MYNRCLKDEHMTKAIRDRAIKKANQSACRYKVSAIGLDKKGNMLGCAMNIQRFSRGGGSRHAEMNLMAQYGTNIKTIIICRTNRAGDVCAIDPCQTCKAKADELGIKIISIQKEGN